PILCIWWKGSGAYQRILSVGLSVLSYWSRCASLALFMTDLQLFLTRTEVKSMVVVNSIYANYGKTLWWSFFRNYWLKRPHCKHLQINIVLITFWLGKCNACKF